MQQPSLFVEGINLLVLGMGFVFVFLVFLVFATSGMSQIVTRFAPAQTAPKPASKSQSAKPTGPDRTLLAVIAAAVHHHKTQQQN
jgi:oxaloacetate decarboxylase gamma subunit